MIDPKNSGACRLTVDQIVIEQQRGRRRRKGGSHGSDVEATGRLWRIILGVHSLSETGRASNDKFFMQYHSTNWCCSYAIRFRINRAILEPVDERPLVLADAEHFNRELLEQAGEPPFDRRVSTNRPRLRCCKTRNGVQRTARSAPEIAEIRKAKSLLCVPSG